MSIRSLIVAIVVMLVGIVLASPAEAYPTMPPGVQGPFVVTKVADGQTIWVDNGGQRMKIRMIGLHTPETVDPRKPVQCFGLEVSAQAKTILGGSSGITSARRSVAPSHGESDETLADSDTKVDVNTGIMAAGRLQSLADSRDYDHELLLMKVQMAAICAAVKSTVPQAMWGEIIEKLDEAERHSEALVVCTDSFDDDDDEPYDPTGFIDEADEF